MEKIKYEKPVILNLGEMAQGMGRCFTYGSGNSTGTCMNGNDTFPDGCSCEDGSSNSGSNCSNGDSTTINNIVCNFGVGNTGRDCGSGNTPNEP